MGEFYWWLWGVLSILNFGGLWLHSRWLKKTTGVLDDCKALIDGPWRQTAKVQGIKACLDGMTDARNHYVDVSGVDAEDITALAYDNMILAVTDVFITEANKLDSTRSTDETASETI